MGGKSVTRVLSRNGLLDRSPDAFFRQSPETLREEYCLSGKAAESLTTKQKESWARTEELERRLGLLGVNLVTPAEANYPTRIEQMDPDPPGVLFLYGNQNLLSSATFSVLSSRNAKTAELEAIERLAEEGVLAGDVLVTGHDRPEYQRSAVVPLRWGAPRILCLDRGLFKVLGDDLRDEAFRTARLWRYEFDPSTDLVVSPFRPEADFIGVNNQVRDRLVACLSDRIDLVSASLGGNMDRLARTALKAGRRVRVLDTIPQWREYQAAGAVLIA
jgi:DNA processing protein